MLPSLKLEMFLVPVAYTTVLWETIQQTSMSMYTTSLFMLLFLLLGNMSWDWYEWESKQWSDMSWLKLDHGGYMMSGYIFVKVQNWHHHARPPVWKQVELCNRCVCLRCISHGWGICCIVTKSIRLLHLRTVNHQSSVHTFYARTLSGLTFSFSSRRIFQPRDQLRSRIWQADFH